ncbi:Reticulon-like protein B9 [Hordeum vulgare]|nr:Reticulon-like protein B9 [Hordeum vulgare]
MSQPDRSTLGPLGELTPTGTAAIPHALPVHQASEAHREVNRELGRATAARNAAGAEGRARQRERSWRRGPGTVRARRWVERGQVQLLLVEDDDSKVVGSLLVLSVIGGSCSFTSLLYVGFLCAHTLPVLYQQYETQVDHLIARGGQDIKKFYEKVDSNLLNKIPRGPVKTKFR